MAILPVGLSAEEAGYQIERSLRFNSADSAYLSRTPSSSPTSNQKFTLSCWVKRTALGGTYTPIYSANDSQTGGAYPTINFANATDQIYLQLDTGGATRYWQTTQVFRDLSAWYHIVWAVDTTQATATNRMKLYVNGSLITAWGTQQEIHQNGTTSINAATEQNIGRFVDYGRHINCYLAEFHMIDGQQLDATSFGETDSDTGVWKPKAYSGSYGTNGFYLDFGDNSSTTALGYDAAGSNDWTPNNFSVTAGAGNDSLVDSPTRYGTDTGAGGEVRGNYATLNPLNANKAATNGNLDLAGTASGGYHNSPSTIAMTTGKWYWEVTCTAYTGDGILIGASTDAYNYLAATSGSNYIGSTSTSWSYYGNNGNKYNNLTGASYGNTFTTNDVIGIALDLDNGAIYFSKNGTWQNSGVPTSGASKTGAAYTTGLTGSTYYAGVSVGNNNSVTMNFGQRPFAYTAPSGFKALCTTNLPEPTIAEGKDYFNAVTYSGTNSNQSITGVGFQPDFLWVKARSIAYTHNLQDAVRGSNKVLFSNLTDAEGTQNSGYGVTSFNSDGFSLGLDSSTSGSVNASGQTYVAWNWKANGAGVSNTAGDITSTVSVNTTSGFSIVTYTGNGSANQTVGHGLGVAPVFGILKDRDTNSNNNQWHVFATAYGDYYGYLSATNAFAATAEFYPTSGSSTTVTIGRSSPVANSNESGDRYVMYLFSAVAGYSAFGSYTGNGSADGPFVYLGFKPKFWMSKRTDSTSSWLIVDGARNTYNIVDDYLIPNSSGAEGSANVMDFLSNGVKFRSTTHNDSGATWIYMAFAENPFKLSLAR